MFLIACQQTLQNRKNSPILSWQYTHKHSNPMLHYTLNTGIYLRIFVPCLQSLSIGGKLVSEFIGGNPSPLNFLLAGGFINQVRVPLN